MILTNLVGSVVALTLSGSIPAANAPAYREYALHAALTNAQAVALRWHLEANLITAGSVSSFRAQPFPDGSSDVSIVFADRYHFRTTRRDGLLFTDSAYDLKWALHFHSVKEHSNAVAQVKHGKNLLTLERAQQVAAAALQSVCPRDAGWVAQPPTLAEQVTWEDDGAKYDVPCYEFQWDGGRDGKCKVGVSGVSSNIVSFDSHSPRLALQWPTNYLGLFGLPPDTVFVESKQLAYRYVAISVMLARASRWAQALRLPIKLPIMRSDLLGTYVGIPDNLQLGGRLDMGDYSFCFAGNTGPQCVYRLKPFTYPGAGAKDLMASTTVIRANEAYQLATNWLTAIALDVRELERTNAVEVQQEIDWSGTGRRKGLLPFFDVRWGPRDHAKVEIRIDGRNRQLRHVRLEDASFLPRQEQSLEEREKLLCIPDDRFLALTPAQLDALVAEFAPVAEPRRPPSSEHTTPPSGRSP
jgi:hypothetical protein